jgi:N-methylhydantoinase A/oxoprolinase/acetone carboxylase beta subunit
MALALGIDTGGTYTDAVLVDHETSRVIAQAKALTTKGDLAVGIRQAMERVLWERPSGGGEVRLVSLSTTLATNAIVEGSGAPVCALLIGYEGRTKDVASLVRALGTERYALIPGGHDISGEEFQPLDLAAARRAIVAHAPHVQAFAISGFFGTRSPAHELAVRDLVRSLTPLPATCGHELTHRLDALRRAATVTLNASLIPLLRDLIAAVEAAMQAEGLRAPLMVVKGDGSLMAAAVAMERPIETILSGPAASAVGARHLAGAEDAVVVDMGGTTTDIALLRKGRPRLSPQGAEVGRWRTMVEAIDAHTAGIGGDSRVAYDEQGDLCVGPRRVMPLSWLSSVHGGVRPELEEQAALLARRPQEATGEFLVLLREYPLGEAGEPPTAAELLEALRQGPLSLRRVQGLLRYPSLYAGYLERLERRGAVARAGLTPTDAAHVLGLYDAWDGAAALFGARLLAERHGLEVEALCRRVIELASRQVAREIVTKAMGEDGLNGHHAEVDSALVASALLPQDDGLLDLTLRLRPAIVAVGAPVGTYLPRVADLLHTRLIVPEHSAAASAVGAVVGSVVSRVHVLVAPQQEGEVLRVNLPGEAVEFGTLPEALAYAQARGVELAREGALRAGAAEVEIEVERQDRTAPVANGWGQDVYVETRFLVTALGRPRLADE